MENAIQPETKESTLNLQNEMGNNCCQVVGELIFLMVTCCPDVSFPLIKLSQHSTNPATEHYKAPKQILRHIKTTKSNGINFWHTHARDNLPHLPFPITKTNDNHIIDPHTQIDDPTTMHGLFECDWGGDSNHRQSIT